MTLDQLNADDFEQRLAAAESRIENLQTALTSARRIGCAIGILMAQHKVPEEQAFAMLASASQSDHRKLRDIAEIVVMTGEIPNARMRLAKPA